MVPIPKNIPKKSGRGMAKKFVPASPASARAISVFPVPGGPSSRIPFGTFAPIPTKRFESRRKSTTSRRSASAAEWPATSAKVVRVQKDFPEPTAKSPPPLPGDCRMYCA